MKKHYSTFIKSVRPDNRKRTDKTIDNLVTDWYMQQTGKHLYDYMQDVASRPSNNKHHMKCVRYSNMYTLEQHMANFNKLRSAVVDFNTKHTIENFSHWSLSLSVINSVNKFESIAAVADLEAI